MKPNNNHSKASANPNNISLSSRDEVKIMNIALTQQAVRSIDIVTRNFDSGVFDNIDFIEAIKQLAISSKLTRIRILIKDSDHVIRNGHRAIELIQQLTSSIEVRKIPEEYKSYNEAFSIYDGKGIIHLRYADRYEGIANFNRPRLATELSNIFNEIWERSTPDQNLRRLRI